MLCSTQQQLLEDVCVASSRYYDATTRLTVLAGRSTGNNFADAQRECAACLGDCRRAKTALKDHKSAHGC